MYIVLGASGHIGGGLVDILVGQGLEVLAVVHNPAQVERIKTKGADAVAVDILDTDALRKVLRRGTRAFLLNPPAKPSTDTDAEEHKTLHSIVEALRGCTLEKVVLQSTYGAQPGDRLGDLSVLYDFEQALFAQDIPVSVLRGAYYMSNWDNLKDAAMEGKLPTMLPADLGLPMVAPKDIAEVAAQLLQEPPEDRGVHAVQGPAEYTPADAAQAFATALQHPVEVNEIPREQWKQAYRDQGFSPEAAEAYTRMIAASVDGKITRPANPRVGSITLQAYIADLVAKG